MFSRADNRGSASARAVAAAWAAQSPDAHRRSPNLPRSYCVRLKINSLVYTPAKRLGNFCGQR